MIKVFFFNDTATTEIYTLSLHDALPISVPKRWQEVFGVRRYGFHGTAHRYLCQAARARSEEHTSELQSPCNLVCRLLLEKKNQINEMTLELSPAFDLVHQLSQHQRSGSS